MLLWNSLQNIHTQNNDTSTGSHSSESSIRWSEHSKSKNNRGLTLGVTVSEMESSSTEKLLTSHTYTYKGLDTEYSMAYTGVIKHNMQSILHYSLYHRKGSYPRKCNKVKTFGSLPYLKESAKDTSNTLLSYIAIKITENLWQNIRKCISFNSSILLATG